jgi:hypothetical protein
MICRQLYDNIRRLVSISKSALAPATSGYCQHAGGTFFRASLPCASNGCLGSGSVPLQKMLYTTIWVVHQGTGPTEPDPVRWWSFSTFRFGEDGGT